MLLVIGIWIYLLPEDFWPGLDRSDLNLSRSRSLRTKRLRLYRHYFGFWTLGPRIGHQS